MYRMIFLWNWRNKSEHERNRRMLEEKPQKYKKEECFCLIPRRLLAIIYCRRGYIYFFNMKWWRIFRHLPMHIGMFLQFVLLEVVHRHILILIIGYLYFVWIVGYTLLETYSILILFFQLQQVKKGNIENNCRESRDHNRRSTYYYCLWIRHI